MDFELNEAQTALRDLTRSIVTDRVTHERHTELERSGGPVLDRALWSDLADAGVLGTTVPEEHGGSGLSLLELLIVLEEAGRVLAPIPLRETIGVLAPTLERFGAAEQQARWLPDVAAGRVFCGLALGDDVDTPAIETRTTLTADGDAYRVEGTKPWVSYGADADVLLVAARLDDAPALIVLPGDADGVTAVRQTLTNRAPSAAVEFDGVPVGGQQLIRGRDAVAFAEDAWRASSCSLQAGNCQGALRLLSAHTSSREQFGKKIAEFQAVAQRAADAFIDAEMVRLTSRQAMYRLAQGWPSAKELHSATFWAGEGAMRVVHAAQHLHGGLGVDTDYPLHRHFLWAKTIEHQVGTPTRELRRLGDVIAAEPL